MKRSVTPGSDEVLHFLKVKGTPVNPTEIAAGLRLPKSALRALHRTLAELKKRRKAWKAPKPRYTRGVLAKYASAVTSASLGAVTDRDSAGVGHLDAVA